MTVGQAVNPIRMTDRLHVSVLRGERMPYEITDHDREVLAGDDADAILAWCEGHPARYQFALDALTERDVFPDVVAALKIVAPRMRHLVTQAEYADAAFAAPTTPQEATP